MQQLMRCANDNTMTHAHTSKPFNVLTYLALFSYVCVFRHLIVTPRNNPAFCRALVKMAQSNCANAVTLDLSSNGIKTLAPIRGLADAMPHIQRLSLAGNELKAVAELGHFKGMDQLQCLVLQV